MKSVSLQNMSKRHIHHRVRNQGFSLIEILVSLVVLSIGLIGLSGLQIVSLKGTNNAHYRTQASLLIMDLSDRMRANVSGVADGDYRLVSSIDCSSSTAKNCADLSCSSSELATFDRHAFACRTKKLLPNGELSIECADNNCTATIEDADKDQRLNKTHTLSISWNEAKKKEEVVSNDEDFNVRSIQLRIVP